MSRDIHLNRIYIYSLFNIHIILLNKDLPKWIQTWINLIFFQTFDDMPTRAMFFSFRLSF